MSDRCLIINADDYGISPGVTRGIDEAMKRGVVTSTSVMVNMPGWDDAAGRLRANPSYGAYGLHLNLVAGRPLTDARTLVNGATGCFHSLNRLIILAAVGRIRSDEIADECSAQFERLRATGVEVSHVDSHRHSHALPAVARAIAPVVRGLPVRFPVDTQRLPGESLDSRFTRLFLANVVGGARQGAPPNARGDYFAGVAIQGSPRFAERLAQLIEALPVGTTELMVHPGYADDVLRSVDSFTAMRESELSALLAPDFRARLAQRGVRLVAGRGVRPAA